MKEVDICKLNAYRALAATRRLRIHRPRPDWKECAAWQVDAAAASVRHARRLRQLGAGDRAAEPLADWERELLANPVTI
jgi:hypothetical protein